MIPRLRALALIAGLLLQSPSSIATEPIPKSPAEIWLDAMAQWLRIMTGPDGSGQLAMLEEFRRLLPCSAQNREQAEAGSGDSCPVPRSDGPEAQQ